METLEQILHEAGIEKMNTDCIQGLTLEQTVERIARLKEYRRRLRTLRSGLSQTITPLIKEISDAGAAIAWHEDVLKAYGTYPQFLKQFSELGARFGDRTFETLDGNIDQRAKATCENYAGKFSDIRYREKNSLILCGDAGIGKTHLAASIANRLLERNVAVFFVNVPAAYERIRDEFGTKDFTKATMKSCDLLILDDLGKERRSEWTDQVFYEVVNSRYENRKPIVVTSNYSAKELSDRIDNAVLSRLFEMSAFVNMTGKDYRKND